MTEEPAEGDGPAEPEEPRSRRRDLRRAAGRAIDRQLRSEDTARAIADVEDRLARLRRERKLGKGTLRATHVVAYRGFVADGQAFVRARVIEEPVVPEGASRLPYSDVLRTNLRRFGALAMPGVTVRLSMADGQEVEAVSDRHGYVSVRLPADGLAPGWHGYRATTVPELEDEEPATGEGRVLLPDATSRYGVISDVDDTVIRTGLTEAFTAMRRTLLRDAHSRQAPPGMASLYRGLARGQDSQVHTFCYVSTGPWNLYDMLTQFLQLRGFPRGPLFLSDWGVNERYLLRSGREHKRQAIDRLLAAYPDLAWVLVGDAGQQDADIYESVARDHPQAVLAIVILDVEPHDDVRAEAMRERAELLADEGIVMTFAADAAEAAGALAALGLVDDSTLDDVTTEMAARY